MSQATSRLKVGHLKHFFFIAILFGFTLFGFQNCSQPLSESGEISSIAANAPFAFDGQVDSVAHMSCGGMIAPYDQEAYFSFAAGAFDAGSGLKYTDAFINHTGGVSPTRRQQIADESPLNKGARYQVAVRSLTDVKQVYGSSNLNQDGFNFGSFDGNLSSADVALQLPQTLGTNRVSNFSGIGQVLMQNDLLQTTTAQGARVEMNNRGALLGTTFSNQSFNAGGVGPSQNTAYGQGFVMDFTEPAHISTPTADTLLVNVAEFDLETRAPTGNTWSCPATLKYMIVRSQDIGVQSTCGGGANLNPGVEEIPANAGQAAELAELRKFLPVSKWGIDLAGRCIVRKSNVTGSSCYGSSNLIRYPSNGTTCDMGLNTCPHYISICNRL